ncbi:MAG: hypothetical protein ACFFGZ_00895 [Candidatus Thorarchaeota archaeon]
MDEIRLEMRGMMVNNRENNVYDKQIEKIESDLKILSRESCLIILANLMIHGRMFYEQLKAQTGLGKATIFRGLDLLLEANYVQKETDPLILDKRKNAYYFVAGKEFRFPKVDKTFISYLEAKEKLYLLNEMSNSLYSMPTAIMKVASKKQVAKSNDNKQGMGKVAYLNLFESEDFAAIQKNVFATIQEIEKLCSKKRRDYKKPLEKGGAVAITLISI